jgi:hypothetical protein
MSFKATPKNVLDSFSESIYSGFGGVTYGTF